MIIAPSMTLRGWCGGLRKLTVGQRRVLTVASKPSENEADVDGFTVLRALERGGMVGRGKRQCKSLRSGTLVKQPPLNGVVLRITLSIKLYVLGSVVM